MSRIHGAKTQNFGAGAEKGARQARGTWLEVESLNEKKHWGRDAAQLAGNSTV